MSLGRPNCGNAAAGGGGGGAALPGALGLGSFPRHDLPAPPDGLDLKAVVAPPVSQVAPAPACPLGPQFRARVRTLDSAFSEADWILRDIQGEIQQMREDGHEKDRQIRSIVEDSEKERQSSHIRIKQFDHDKELMRRFLQGCKENLKKSSDAFLEYKKMCEGSGVSSSGVVADEQNRILMMPQEYAENINALERDLDSSFAACAKEITMLETRITNLKNERQRLNDYIQIPDLNNGGPQL